MNGTDRAPGKQNRVELVEIRVKGHLAGRWSPWFDSLTITLEENGDTRLTGPVVDQAALHGLLRKVRDCGLPLISVKEKEDSSVRNTDKRSGGKRSTATATWLTGKSGMP